MTFWLNGQYRDDPQAISITDRGFLLGDGVFETIRVSRGTPIFLREHLDRMRAGLAALSIDAELPEFSEIISAIAERNSLMENEAVCRITVSRGGAGRGLAPAETQPTLLVSVEGTIAPSPAIVRLVVTTYRRYRGALNAQHKLLAYQENIAARRQALENGADDAVMLNEEGRVACAAASNIFVIHRNKIITPPIEEGALPGIVRDRLIEQARSGDQKITERALEIGDLSSGEIFLTNSLVGLQRAVLASHSAHASASSVFTEAAAIYKELVQRDIDAFAARS